MEIKWFKFQEHKDQRGGLVAIEDYELPFVVKRVYYIFDVDGEERRGFHAHKQLEQVMICVHGSCKVLLDNGSEREEVVLNRPDEGIYVGPGVWRETYEYSEDAVLMVLASRNYEEEDYMREYKEFKEYIQEK